jgi:type II secretory pathway component PulF
MVRAGETGGFLDVVLSQIADFRAREQELKGKVKAAMIYPIVLAVLAVGVVTFLMEYFIPRFSGIFAQFGASLPALTLFVIALSNIVKHYGVYLAIVIVVGLVLFRRAIATDIGRRKMEQALLAVPLLGPLIAHFALVRFARMLGTLIGAGVPLIAALRVAREAIGNQTLSDTVVNAIEEVQRGAALSRALGASPKLFPASVVEMIAVAEETGRLDKELLRVATTYEGDLDRQLRTVVSIGEPILLFAMAGIIGTIVVSMLLPILSLSDVIK